jgi:hypothetical protein
LPFAVTSPPDGNGPKLVDAEGKIKQIEIAEGDLGGKLSEIVAGLGIGTLLAKQGNIGANIKADLGDIINVQAVPVAGKKDSTGIILGSITAEFGNIVKVEGQALRGNIIAHRKAGQNSNDHITPILSGAIGQIISGSTLPELIVADNFISSIQILRGYTGTIQGSTVVTQSGGTMDYRGNGVYRQVTAGGALKLDIGQAKFASRVIFTYGTDLRMQGADLGFPKSFATNQSYRVPFAHQDDVVKLTQLVPTTGDNLKLVSRTWRIADPNGATTQKVNIQQAVFRGEVSRAQVNSIDFQDGPVITKVDTDDPSTWIIAEVR